MKTCLQAVGLALVALWMGCADFEQAEQEFCDRNPDRCGPSSPYSKLAFTTAPQTVQVGSCSGATTVQLQDTGNSPVSATADTTVALSAAPPEGFQFFAAASCTGTAVTSVAIRAGSNSTSFYFKGTRAGAAMLNASAGSISGSQSVTLSPSPPAAVALTLPTSPVTAGTCTSASVQVKDANGSDTRVGAATSVSLEANPLGGIVFYSDAGCTAPVASVTLAAGEGSVTFYFQGQITGSVTVNATADGLTQGSKVAQIIPGQGNRLILTSPPRTATAGACSAVVQFQSRDAQGNLAPMTVDTAVALAASPATGFTFYSNANCTTEVTSVTLATGASDGSFYFKGTKSGSVTVTLTAPGFTGTSQAESLNPGPPAAVVFSDTQTVQAGVCSAAVTVELRDAYNNVAAAVANTAVNLTAFGTPSDPQFRFYSDTGCGTPVSSVSIPLGQSTASFYYKGERARTVTLTATAPGLPSTTQDHTLVAGDAAALAFATVTAVETLLAGTCSTLRTVETLDSFGNLATNGATINLSGSTTAEFFSDLNCTTPVTQIAISGGSSSANFYFKGFTGGINANGPLTLTASATGLASASQSETIIPTVRTGSCIMSFDASVTCNIEPALLDVNKAFLVFQATSRNTTSDRANVRCSLRSSREVVCERTTNGGNDVNIRWSVAEFPSGVRVQHQSVDCEGDTTSVPLSAVTMDRTFLLLSSQRSSPDMEFSVMRLATLTSQDKAEIWKRDGCGATIDNNYLQVVDYAGAETQRGLILLSNGETSTQGDLASSVAPDRSILLYSYYSAELGTRICERALRGELTNDGRRLTFSRGDGDGSCSGSSAIISWEVVQFPVGTVVHPVTQQLFGRSASVTLPEVDLSRTIVIGGGQWASGQVHGEGKRSTSELISDFRAHAHLVNSTTLEFFRETDTNNSATFTAYVVELKP